MIFEDDTHDDEPCYIISVAAKLVRLHPQTLRYYERLGLIQPSRSAGNVRLYSSRDIIRLRKIVRLTDELGLNLAGVEVILRMGERMKELQREMELMQADLEMEINRLHSLLRQERVSGPHERS
ncbi:MAG: helix-turn-helix transcriptional regulator [Chloroflexota bacterium]|nr:helix-turn-helix transcriptional regulator [Anaerolineae bacterium]